MVDGKKEKVWVCFEGRRPGIYFSWPDCQIQVDGFKGNHHKSFDSYEQGQDEFIRYCTKKGRGDAFVRSHLPRRDGEGRSREPAGGEVLDRNSWTAASNIGLAEDSTSDKFIFQLSMQKQLEVVCRSLQIQQPQYTLHERKEINGVEYMRYYAALFTDSIGRPAVSVGRFGKDEYDAKEDVAALLLQRLMASTGKSIRDINHYNVQLLQQQLQQAMDANLELEMEIAILTEQLRLKNMG